MLTKAKMLYQVKLILDYLPEEEYNLIPKETINYNMDQESSEDLKHYRSGYAWCVHDRNVCSDRDNRRAL